MTLTKSSIARGHRVFLGGFVVASLAWAAGLVFRTELTLFVFLTALCVSPLGLAHVAGLRCGRCGENQVRFCPRHCPGCGADLVGRPHSPRCWNCDRRLSGRGRGGSNDHCSACGEIVPVR